MVHTKIIFVFTHFYSSLSSNYNRGASWNFQRSIRKRGHIPRERSTVLLPKQRHTFPCAWREGAMGGIWFTFSPAHVPQNKPTWENHFGFSLDLDSYHVLSFSRSASALTCRLITLRVGTTWTGMCLIGSNYYNTASSVSVSCTCPLFFLCRSEPEALDNYRYDTR